MLPNEKKMRLASTAATAGAPVAACEPTTPTSAPAPSPAFGTTSANEGCTFGALPTVAISDIGSFALESSLSGACRSTLHYKVNLSEDSLPFSPNADPSGAAARGHLGLQASGALATGRVITQITITGVGSSRMRNDMAGYEQLEEVVKRVIRHSIATLREIAISGGNYRGNGRAPGRDGVNLILGDLAPLSSKTQRVAPSLARVDLAAGAAGVTMAGRAVAAGLWPALEVLTFSHCRANARTFKNLAVGLGAGLAPRLRMLSLDNESYLRGDPVDDVILAALARGRCPAIEHLSFMGEHRRLGNCTDSIFEALRACPRLLTLRMDCRRTPDLQLLQLARALEAGHAPRLEHLFVRAIWPRNAKYGAELRALTRVAASREPPVELKRPSPFPSRGCSHH